MDNEDTKRRPFPILPVAISVTVVSLLVTAVATGRTSCPSLGFDAMLLPGQTVSKHVDQDWDTAADNALAKFKESDGWEIGSIDYDTTMSGEDYGALSFERGPWEIVLDSTTKPPTLTVTRHFWPPW